MSSIRHGRRLLRSALPAALLLLAGAAPHAVTATDHAPEKEAGRTIVFAGDIILGGAINAFAAERGSAALLGQVPELREADLAIANLESVATAHGVRQAEKGGQVPFHFRARPETLQVLAAAGIDAVATANNHSGDYGPAALIEHRGLLEGLGIAYAGSGRTAAEACAPVYLDAGDGIRIAFFSADATQPAFGVGESAGTCHLGLGDIGAWEEQFTESLAMARRHAHATFVAIHWGDNFVSEPSEEKRALGRRLIELGADAILGTNAHQLQGLEAHGDGVIVHDAAHLLADFAQPVDTAIFEFRVTEHGLTGVEVVPLVAETGHARRPSASEAERILSTLSRQSAELGADLDGARLRLAPDPRDPPLLPSGLVRPAPGTAPPPATSPPPACVTDHVPADAWIAPVSLGPLTLVGFRVDQERAYLPELVEVDTYWRVERAVSASHWIAPTGSTDDGRHGAWTSHHEPCDWAWPTSRWTPGIVYHDRSTLRPPADTLSGLGAAQVASGLLGPLEVSVGVTRDGVEIARTGQLDSVGLGAPLAVQLLVGAVLAALGVVAARLAWRRQQRGR